MVFKKLREHELYLRKEKCELFAAKVNCLGHMIDEKGLHTDTDKMAKICDWNRPHNFKDVQRFLGLVQYLAHFLPYSPQRMSDYIRQWYWWPHIYMDTEKFCKSCKICAQAKGEYQK